MPLGRAAAWGSGGFDEQDTRNEERVRRDFWRKAARVAARLPFAEDLLAAYYCAFDQATPFQVRAALVGALAYFVLPFDFLPDVLPLLGFTDDAAVLLTALRMVAGHLRPEHRDAARAALERIKADKT
ncbi:MAG: YkvA family protein [Xanthobacteraceae bacterium]